VKDEVAVMMKILKAKLGYKKQKLEKRGLTYMRGSAPLSIEVTPTKHIIILLSQ